MQSFWVRMSFYLVSANSIFKITPAESKWTKMEMVINGNLPSALSVRLCPTRSPNSSFRCPLLRCLSIPPFLSSPAQRCMVITTHKDKTSSPSTPCCHPPCPPSPAPSSPSPFYFQDKVPPSSRPSSVKSFAKGSSIGGFVHLFVAELLDS